MASQPATQQVMKEDVNKDRKEIEKIKTQRQKVVGKN